MQESHETLGPTLDGLGRRGGRAALLEMRAEDVRAVSFETLAERAAAGARSALAAGVERGEAVALLAAPSADWIAACLVLLRAGAVPVPLDTQLEREDLERVLADSGARRILADAAARERLERVQHRCELHALDGGDGADQPAWWRPLAPDTTSADEGPPLPELRPDDRALLLYTSGTTGAPKGVPLAHRHLAFQIEAVRRVDLVGERDRVLLPLPLHHVYPLVDGVLAPLALGATVVLPRSLTGPALLRALRESEATAIVAVPRIYDALRRGLEDRVASAGPLARGTLRALIAACAWSRRRLRLNAGRVLLRPLRRRVGPALRLLVSGGAALDRDLAARLEGLGWEVATGYGLTETAPLLTIRRPGGGRLGSAGRPVPGVELSIARERGRRDGDEGDVGEVLARGPGVFDGYLNLEEETRESFTEDGWFRTGDLGRLDDDGHLHLSGRKSTRIVGPSGENIRTEKVEEDYERHERIEEIGLLSDEDGLAAVVVPAVAEIRDAGLDVEQEVRAALDRRAESMPSYQRIGRFEWTPSPLDRTRLGKLRRQRLRERYDELREGSADGGAERRAPLPPEDMRPADRDLVSAGAARDVWELLAERFHDRGLTPDSDLRLDLGVDSIGWLDLGVSIAERAGLELDEERIAEVRSVRDLLEAVSEGAASGDASSPLDDPEGALDERQRRWLEPLSPPAARAARVLSALNRAALRVLHRLEVRGSDRLPGEGPVVLAPNHASYLDPFALAAALPESARARTFWGGWTGVAFQNAAARAFSRLARAVPVQPRRPAASSLAFALLALRRGGFLVWFAEGRRSPSGELGEFRPGLARLLEEAEDARVVPVHLAGTHAAWPPGQRLPRPRRVRVAFGTPIRPAELARSGEGEDARERITRGLRERVRQLGRE